MDCTSRMKSTFFWAGGGRSERSRLSALEAKARKMVASNGIVLIDRKKPREIKPRMDTDKHGWESQRAGVKRSLLPSGSIVSVPLSLFICVILLLRMNCVGSFWVLGWLSIWLFDAKD